MSAYLVITYNVTNHERYADYNPGSLPTIMQTLAKHGGEPVFEGHPATLSGPERAAAVCLRFPSAAAAQAWLDDPDYAGPKAIRLESTGDVHTYISEGFVPPQP